MVRGCSQQLPVTGQIEHPLPGLLAGFLLLVNAVTWASTWQALNDYISPCRLHLAQLRQGANVETEAGGGAGC